MAIFSRRSKQTQELDFDTAFRQLVAQHGIVFTEGPGDAISFNGQSMNLSNLRVNWRDHRPEHRLQWLEGAVSEMLLRGVVPAQPIDPSQLRIGVRSRATFAIQALLFQRQGVLGNRVKPLPIVGDFGWCTLVDGRSSMEPLGESRIAESGSTEEELFNIGLANLKAEPIASWTAKAGVFSPIGNEDYVCSHVFLPGALDHLPLAGNKVVFHPNRRTALVTSQDDPVALSMAANFVLEQLQQGTAHPISLEPVVSGPDGWSLLELDPSHPAYQACRTLTLGSYEQNYGQQQQLLQEVFGDDLFVASFKAAEDPNGEMFSYSTWTHDVRQLLPKTDFIGFVDSEPKFLGMVPWDRVQQVCGHLMEPTAHWPARTRALEFPSNAELAELVKHATL